MIIRMMRLRICHSQRVWAFQSPNQPKLQPRRKQLRNLNAPNVWFCSQKQRHLAILPPVNLSLGRLLRKANLLTILQLEKLTRMADTSTKRARTAALARNEGQPIVTIQKLSRANPRRARRIQDQVARKEQLSIHLVELTNHQVKARKCSQTSKFSKSFRNSWRMITIFPIQLGLLAKLEAEARLKKILMRISMIRLIIPLRSATLQILRLRLKNGWVTLRC